MSDTTVDSVSGPGGPLARGALRSEKALASLRDYTVVACLIALFIVLSATTPNFLTTTNLLNILDQNAALGIVACGMTLVMIGGGFDLAVGAMYALAGVLAAWMALKVDPALGLAAGVLAGAIMGAFNGGVISALRLNSFLATLATSLMFSGVALYITDGFLIDVSTDSTFTAIGQTKVADIPVAVLFFAGTAVVLGLVLARTIFGRYVYALGGNAEALRLSGISRARIRIATFVISGATAGLAGILETARSGVGQADVGAGLPLDAIAAVVIGGTSILGGRGAMWRTIVGVLLLAFMNNGLNILNVAPYFQDLITGAVMIVAVAANAVTGRG
jgi:ribose transport system permease protein